MLTKEIEPVKKITFSPADILFELEQGEILETDDFLYEVKRKMTDSNGKVVIVTKDIFIDSIGPSDNSPITYWCTLRIDDGSGHNNLFPGLTEEEADKSFDIVSAGKGIKDVVDALRGKVKKQILGDTKLPDGKSFY